MSKLFPTVPLSQIAAISMGQSPDSSTVNELGAAGLPFLQGNAEFGEKHPSPKYSCIRPPRIGEMGATLISVRAPVGQTNIADRDYCIGRGLAAVKSSQYGPVLCRSIMAQQAGALRKVSQGTTFEAIGRDDLFSLLIPQIPPKEAEFIESILDTLDTQIQKTEALIAKLEKIKEGLLHDLLTRGIDKNGQLRPSPKKAPELYKEWSRGIIPKNWAAATFQEISSIIIDGTHYTPTYMESGVPFLRVTNLHNRDINLSKFKYISDREHKILSARCNPRQGDILLSKNGTVGIAKMVSWDWDFSIFVSLALIRLKDDSGVTPQFAELLINSPIVARQIAIQSKQGTVTNLHLEEIRKFIIPIPDLREQQNIVREVNRISTLIDKETDEREKLLSLKQGLSEDLLSGKVRTLSMLKDAV